MGLFGKKKFEVIAPCEGAVVTLGEVDDEVFSLALAGGGIAIKPSSGLFVSPIEGVITKIFETNHAYSIKGAKNFEVLVHIGLDTVNLKGEGFERLASEGDKVKAGSPIIKADLAYIKTHAKDTITPVVVVDNDEAEITPNLGECDAFSTIMEVKV